jgi:TRAP-type C4-dicarboxylate transport system substrate-binding protein
MQRLEQLSGGQVRIKNEQEWGHNEPGFEQQIVTDVAAGKADLGWTGTRVFDTLGVTSFQALTAPMLIDSYPLEDAVLASPIPQAMLRSLDSLHVTGLAVLGGGLRRPIAKDKPLLSPADWKGVTFNTLRSKVAIAAVAAAGAVPVDEGIRASHAYAAAAPTLRIYLENYIADFRYVTANVNLWPETLALFANPARLARLTDQQRAWVQTAAQDAAARSTALSDRDKGLVATSCAKGARLAQASPDDVVQLRSRFDGVYTDLEKDPSTASYITQIEAMKKGQPAPPGLDIPAACNAARPAPTTADPLEGVWATRDLTQGDIVHAFVAAGGSEAEAHEWFPSLGGGAKTSVTFQIRFGHGALDQYERADGGGYLHGDSRTYVVDGDAVIFSSPGCEGRYTLQLTGDALRLGPVTECPGHDKPYAITIYGSFPFQRVS